MVLKVYIIILYAIFRPVAFTRLFTLLFFGLGLALMETKPHVTFDKFALRHLFYSFGKFRGLCNVSRGEFLF